MPSSRKKKEKEKLKERRKELVQISFGVSVRLWESPGTCAFYLFTLIYFPHILFSLRTRHRNSSTLPPLSLPPPRSPSQTISPKYTPLGSHPTGRPDKRHHLISTHCTSLSNSLRHTSFADHICSCMYVDTAVQSEPRLFPVSARGRHSTPRLHS